MRRVLCCLVALTLAGSAYADLQNIELGGVIRIRGRYWHQVLNADGRQARISGGQAPGRPVGPYGITSLVDFDDHGGDLSFVEHRTAIHVKADFTDEVSAFIELDAYDLWGDTWGPAPEVRDWDFRSNYITGVDSRATTINDVEVMQSYIDVNELHGYPVRLRIGRQELVMGKGWLVGSQISPCLHMSYDGIRLTYGVDDFVLDAWWAKLAENSPLEEDGDVDFYGIYGTYKALGPADISLYWLYIRDAQARDMDDVFTIEWLEELFGFDQYDPTNLHTVGLRVWGGCDAFDYNLELAYQFGNADAVGAQFPMWSFWGTYGDDDADFDAWAFDLEVGYTFDVNWQPRVFLGGAYFEGEDNRDITFWEWLNLSQSSSASVSFNRLFSAKWYTSIFDVLGGAGNMSNFYQVRAGVSARPAEKIEMGLMAGYFVTDEVFDWPPYLRIGRVRVPFAPAMSFWTRDGEDDLGVITHIWMKYAYSEDWWVKIGWEHLFADDGLYDGSFVKQNGLDLFAGTDDADADYLYFDTGIEF